MKWHVRPFALGIGTFLAVLAIGAALPRWRIYKREGTRHWSEDVTLPEALHHKFLGAGRNVYKSWHDDFSRECLYLLALSAGAGATGYLAAAWRRRRPEGAADFKEGPDGAVLDGRGEPPAGPGP